MSKNDLVSLLHDTAATGVLPPSLRARIRTAIDDIESEADRSDRQVTDQDDDFREATGQLETRSQYAGQNDAGEWIGMM